jgi:threonine dehydrogenase-like Zn-dependent dehydrogenase
VYTIRVVWLNTGSSPSRFIGDIDPSVIRTHRMRLEQAPEAYRMFANKEDNCIKLVLRP